MDMGEKMGIDLQGISFSGNNLISSLLSITVTGAGGSFNSKQIGRDRIIEDRFISGYVTWNV